MPGYQAKAMAAMINAVHSWTRRAYHLVRDTPAARLAGLEAQQDRAASTDADG